MLSPSRGGPPVRIAQVSRIVAFIALAAALCSGESITGVVLSNHRGPAADFSGTVDLATAGRIRTLYYDRSLQRHFTRESCSDIGAIWTVVVLTSPDSSLYADSATCDGKFDQDVRNTWLIVREYLATTGNASPGASPKLFSSAWLSSPDRRVYEDKTEHLDLRGHRLLGSGGMCIDVLGMSQAEVTKVRAGGDCHLAISGKPVELVFTVGRRNDDKRWEIDAIDIRQRYLFTA